MAPRGGGPSRYSEKRKANPLTSPPKLSSTPTQATFSPEVSIPEIPDSVAANTSAPSSSLEIETPRNEIISSSSSNSTNGTRIPIEIVLGRLEPANNVSCAITNFFKEKLDPEGHDWKSVTPEKPHWETDAFKAKSTQCSKNHLSEKCGEGSGPSRHTGGSRSHREHARQLEIVLGRSPHPHELLKKTHIKANNEFVDMKSKSTYDAVVSKIISASQPVDESVESPTVDFSKIYMDEVGGVKKACIYGLGSQAVYYKNAGPSSSSTSKLQDHDFDTRVKECVQEMKEVMKHEMREEMREEIRQELREEMRNEMRQEMQEQVDKILQDCLTTLIAGLPAPPTDTPPV